MANTSADTQTHFESESDQLLDSAITLNLQLSYEERIEAHENALMLVMDLKIAGEGLHAKPERTS